MPASEALRFLQALAGFVWTLQLSGSGRVCVRMKHGRASSLKICQQEDAGVYTDSIVQGTLTNANNKNYDIVFTPGTFTIEKRVISININNPKKACFQKVKLRNSNKLS